MLGTVPFLLGSISTAARIARDTALKHPSILWWSLRPRITSMCKLQLAAFTKPCQKSSKQSVWNEASFPPLTETKGMPVKFALETKYQLINQQEYKIYDISYIKSNYKVLVGQDDDMLNLFNSIDTQCLNCYNICYKSIVTIYYAYICA